MQQQRKVVNVMTKNWNEGCNAALNRTRGENRVGWSWNQEWCPAWEDGVDDIQQQARSDNYRSVSIRVVERGNTEGKGPEQVMTMHLGSYVLAEEVSAERTVWGEGVYEEEGRYEPSRDDRAQDLALAVLEAELELAAGRLEGEEDEVKLQLGPELAPDIRRMLVANATRMDLDYDYAVAEGDLDADTVECIRVALLVDGTYAHSYEELEPIDEEAEPELEPNTEEEPGTEPERTTEQKLREFDESLRREAELKARLAEETKAKLKAFDEALRVEEVLAAKPRDIVLAENALDTNVRKLRTGGGSSSFVTGTLSAAERVLTWHRENNVPSSRLFGGRDGRNIRFVRNWLETKTKEMR